MLIHILKPPRNLGVGTKLVIARRDASARSGRCNESGLILMAVTLFLDRMQRPTRLEKTAARPK